MSIETTTDIQLSYNADGLIPAIIVDDADKDVLMFAWMNSEALGMTRKTGLIHFYSRSRKKLWMKGETSGEIFKVADMRVDCDQDCLLISVVAQKTGAACHTGKRSCFYRRIEGKKLTLIA